MQSSQDNAANPTESNDIEMPFGVMNIILGYEDEGAIRVSKNAPLVPTLFNAIRPRKLKKLKALLTAIVNGDPSEAKTLLDKDASLLQEKLEENDYVTALTGHKFNLSPYQAALSVDDTQMADLVRSYFKDETEANKQKNAQQNPEQKIAQAEQEKWQPIFDKLKVLTHAIAKSTTNSKECKEPDLISSGSTNYIVTVKKRSPVETELHAFSKLLDTTRDEVITAGKKPFNPNLLLDAWKTYNNNKCYKDYFGGSSDDPRALLYWQKVIGYDGIQRIMPVNYVQAFQDRLEDAVKKLQTGQPQTRGTEFKVYVFVEWIPVNFYPLRGREATDFNFALYGAAKAAQFCVLPRAWGPNFEAYVNQKQQPTRTYASTPTQST